jgi:hypothetical protein
MAHLPLRIPGVGITWAQRSFETVAGDTIRGSTPEPKLFTVEEVAAAVGVSPRWLADECRADRVVHVLIARKRRFTADQVDQLLQRHTVQPAADRRADAARARVIRRLDREAAQRGPFRAWPSHGSARCVRGCDLSGWSGRSLGAHRLIRDVRSISTSCPAMVTTTRGRSPAAAR